MRMRSKGAQILCGRLARATILSKLEAYLLTVLERGHACALYGGDVHEYVSSTVIRLYKAKTLGAVEPFHCSRSHVDNLSIAHGKTPPRFRDVSKPILSGFS